MEAINKIFPQRIRKQKYSSHKPYHLEVQGPGEEIAIFCDGCGIHLHEHHMMKKALVLGQNYEIK